MPFRDMPTLEACQRMANASICLERIAKHETVAAWAENNKGKPLVLTELLRLVCIVLNDCYADAREALSILTGKPREIIDKQPLAESLKDIDSLAGGSLLSFFSLSSGTAQGE